MAKKMEKLAEEIHELTDIEKLRLVDVILKDLDKPDPRSTGFGRWRHANVGQRTRPVEAQRFLESVMAKHRGSWKNNWCLACILTYSSVGR